MKLSLCKSSYDDAVYFIKESIKLGYEPYEDKYGFICIDILDHRNYWHSETMQYKPFEHEVTEVIFTHVE